MRKDIPTRIFFLIILLLTPVLFFGCGEKVPKIQLGSDRCDFCGMIISDVKYAGIYYSTVEKRWKKFDDVGCMIMESRKKGDAKEGTMYVFDYETGERIEAKKAYYVVSPDIWTPMNTGIVAFKDRDRAQKLADKYSVKVMTFDEVMKIKVSMGRMGSMGGMPKGRPKGSVVDES